MVHDYKDFGCNVNPLGPPHKLLKLLNSDLETILSSYPDYKNKEAIKALSDFYGLPEETLAIGNGSTEFFFAIPRALDIGGGLVIIPTFWEYDFSLITLNKKVKYFETIPQEKFQINFSELEKSISETQSKNGKNAVYICNPNNPTSTLNDSNDILYLTKRFPEVKFIIDETYLLFRSEYDHLTLMKQAHQHPNLAVVTSFSKFFTVPGVRIGVCASNEQDIDSIKKHQTPYGVSSLAQIIIPYLIQDKEFIESSRRFMEAERDRIYNLLKENPNLHSYKPEANFVLAELKNSDSTTLCNCLQKDGITIRDGAEFKGLGSSYIRFAIKTKNENDLLLKKISDFYKHN